VVARVAIVTVIEWTQLAVIEWIGFTVIERIAQFIGVIRF